MKTKVSIGLLVVVAVLASACESTTQISSGQAYLDKYQLSRLQAALPEPSADNIPLLSPGYATPHLDRKIVAAAKVEPILTFPARIGLARIDNGHLAPIPQPEADAWIATAKSLGPTFGEFVPISPLIVSMVAAETRGAVRYQARWRARWRARSVDEIVRRIRLGAARQHLDAVLIYEVFGRGSQKATPLSVADLTVIGAYLMPSRALKARGFANAILIDVRNGYPYGTARALVKDSSFVPTAGSTQRTADLVASAKTAAAVALTANVRKMAWKLYGKLTRARWRRNAEVGVE